jgi:uncharacterized membrane protein
LAFTVGVVVFVMTILAIVRWNVWSYGTDTGTFAQIASNAFRGFTDGPEGGTHFRFHWSPILAVLWPIVAMTRTPLSIQIVQVVLIAATAIPLAAIVRAYAGDAWALRIAILALIYPPLLSASFEEFHELAFYPVTALALFWAADRARWIWFAFFALAAILIREDACVDVFVIGIAIAVIGVLKRKTAQQRGLLYGEPIQPRRLAVAGFALAAFSAVALCVYAYVIVPQSGGWAPSHFYRYPYADGPAQTVLAIFTHPLALGASVLTLGRFTYVLEAFAPLAFLPMRTRWIWLAIPGFAGVLLASDSIVWRMGFHYELLWAPWLLLAAGWALVRIARGNEAAARRWWNAAAVICVVVLAAFNPMHPAHYLLPAAYEDSAHVTAAFACIPNAARVATHDEWFAHEAIAYPHSTIITADAQRFNGYIAYTPRWRNAYVETYVLPGLRADLRERRYSVVCRAGDVLVVRPTRTARYAQHSL